MAHTEFIILGTLVLALAGLLNHIGAEMEARIREVRGMYEDEQPIPPVVLGPLDICELERSK